MRTKNIEEKRKQLEEIAARSLELRRAKLLGQKICAVCGDGFTDTKRYGKRRVCSSVCYQQLPKREKKIVVNRWTYYDPLDDPWRPKLEEFLCNKTRVLSHQVWSIIGVNPDLRTYVHCRRLGLVMRSLGFKRTTLGKRRFKQRGYRLR